MATSNHYKSNLRDIFFNVFEVQEFEKNVCNNAPYKNIDRATAEETLAAFETLCTEKIAPSFAEGDAVALKLNDKGDVELPKGIREAVLEVFKGDWHRLDVSEEHEGFGMPPSIYWASFELLVGANAPVGLYLCSTFALNIIDELGTDSQKARFIGNFVNKHWGSTMVLTEADAGSDVGAGRTSAVHVEGEEWHLNGVKRFITNGDYDATENIVHMVLARREGGEPGTKGLSMFLVPKFWVNEDGSLGERNGVFCSNIEKKMGIKASATCELTFGENKPARALLLGNVHQGIRQMFKVIERARMAVGVKSMSELSTGYLNALEYCKERVQGTDLAKALDRDAPKVTIINHPDVRRMLMTQKSHVEGMRALCSYCAHLLDMALIAEKAGDAEKASTFRKQNDLLLPLVKGYNSEKAYELLSMSLQCFGGSGYLKDYPIEQYMRDQKIDSLYEGTSHIQALDLLFRKIARDGGQTLQGLLKFARDMVSEKSCAEALSTEYAELDKALGVMDEMMGTMMMKVGESIYHAGFQGNRFLMSLSEVIIAWRLVRHAEVAHKAMATASEDDKNFYAGKIASAHFYTTTVLPALKANLQLMRDSSLELMEVPEAAF